MGTPESRGKRGGANASGTGWEKAEKPELGPDLWDPALGLTLAHLGPPQLRILAASPFLLRKGTGKDIGR